MKMIEVQQRLREAEWKREVDEARKQAAEEGRTEVIVEVVKGLTAQGENKENIIAQLMTLFNLTTRQAEAYYAAAMTQTKA